ncbi:transcription factor RFX3-like isoform X2 [Dysidea avara]|uniref:transcription factor RFX3-like isoform X2 n=1 Tax=Dysidea avara TaxID=196820 RepID=UPI003322FD7A
MSSTDNSFSTGQEQAAANVAGAASKPMSSQMQQQQLLMAARQQLLQQIQSGMMTNTLVLSQGAPTATTTVTVSTPAYTSDSSSFSDHGLYYDTAQQLMGGQQIVSSTGGSVMLQSHNSSGTAMMEQHLSLAPSGTRASPATVQWLLEHFETADGVSLPRSTLYNHYLRHCAANKIDAVNAASFGKLIRSVFVGLKTRRLGTRGNSKYHYYGIRIKPDSPLNTFPQDEIVAIRSAPNQQRRDEMKEEGGADHDLMASGSGHSAASTMQQQHQQYLGDVDVVLQNFPEIEWGSTPIPVTITDDHLSEFTILYREHCEAILDVVVNLQFQMVEALWQNFWRSANAAPPSPGSDTNDDFEQRLPKDKLALLIGCTPVVTFMCQCDYMLYQCIVDVLIPEVLRHIPGTLTQAIRNFAKSLEGWLSSSLQGYPSAFTSAKLAAVVAFSQTLRRYTSLNHLAQAARAVLQNSTQISQMLADLNRVDFANVQEQASWVCQCEESLVSRLEQSFKQTLQQQNSLEQWATWLDDVVSHVLQPYEASPQFSKAARQFLLKWSFYSSMVIRDLTLRSAASFGSFHLIRLLYDEYMFYLVEHRVAKANNKTAIAVMSEFSSLKCEAFSDTMTMSGDIATTTITTTIDEDDTRDDGPPTKKARS